MPDTKEVLVTAAIALIVIVLVQSTVGVAKLDVPAWFRKA